VEVKKANDKDVPEDEILLAEALAAAHEHGLRWCKGSPFERDDGSSTPRPSEAAKCCALGALFFAGRLSRRLSMKMTAHDVASLGINTGQVFHGNDRDERWLGDWSAWQIGDRGESLGWAFRCAMTQES
jgi:hypothetical protein